MNELMSEIKPMSLMSFDSNKVGLKCEAILIFEDYQ